MDEFNQRNEDVCYASELNAASEFPRLKENARGSEFGETGERAAFRGKRRKSGQKQASLFSAFLTSVVAVAFIGAAGVPAAGTKAEIAELWATDTGIGYQVVVEEETKPLKIVAYNDFTRRELDLAAGENEGFFSGLKPDMPYTVAIEGNFGFGAHTLSQKRVRTDKLRPPLVTKWRGITHECTCNIDGYFRFTMDFIDENGRWTDFWATLSDEYGNTAACVFSDDPHAEQKIDVVGRRLIGNRATFIVGCTRSGEKTELYRAQVKI